MSRTTQLACLFLLLLSHSLTSALASEISSYRLGIQAFQEGDFAAALSYFQQEENQGAASVTLYFNLGSTHYRLGNHDQAASYFTRVSEDEKWGALAEYNLGLIAEQQGSDADAIQHYRKASSKASTERVRNLAQGRIRQLSSEETVTQEGFVYLSASLGYDDNLSLSNDDPAIEKISGSFLETLASGQFYLKGDTSHGSSLTGYLFARQPGVSEMETEVAFNLGAQLHRSWGDWQARAGAALGNYQLDGSSYTRDLALQAEGRYPLGGLQLRLNNELKLIRGGDDFNYLDGWQNRARIRLVSPGHWEMGYQNELNQREDLSDDPMFYSYSPTRQSVFARVNFRLSEQLLLTSRLEGRFSQYPDREVDAVGNRTEEKRQDLRWRAALNASYRLTSVFSLFAELEHLTNSSNFDDYEYASNQFQLGVDAVF